MTQINVIEVNQDTQIQKSNKQYLESLGDFTAESFVVTSETEKQVSDTLRAIKLSIKEIVERRKEITKGIDEAKSNAMAQQKLLVEPMEVMERQLKNKLNFYLDKKERIQEEIEHKLREEKIEALKKEQAEILEQAEINKSDLALEDAADIDDEIEQVKEEPMIKTDVSVRSNFSSVHRRETWHVEVTDITKLPETYKMVNQKLLDNSVRGKTGLREIPGCRIFSKKDISSRK